MGQVECPLQQYRILAIIWSVASSLCTTPQVEQYMEPNRASPASCFGLHALAGMTIMGWLLEWDCRGRAVKILVGDRRAAVSHVPPSER